MFVVLYLLVVASLTYADGRTDRAATILHAAKLGAEITYTAIKRCKCKQPGHATPSEPRNPKHDPDNPKPDPKKPTPGKFPPKMVPSPTQSNNPSNPNFPFTSIPPSDATPWRVLSQLPTQATVELESSSSSPSRAQNNFSHNATTQPTPASRPTVSVPEGAESNKADARPPSTRNSYSSSNSSGGGAGGGSNCSSSNSHAVGGIVNSTSKYKQRRQRERQQQ